MKRENYKDKKSKGLFSKLGTFPFFIVTFLVVLIFPCFISWVLINSSRRLGEQLTTGEVVENNCKMELVVKKLETAPTAEPTVAPTTEPDFGCCPFDELIEILRDWEEDSFDQLLECLRNFC